MAPIFIFAGITCFVGYHTYHFGYNVGAKSATQLLRSGWINQLILGASILGLFMMGGLAASYVNVSTPLVLNTGNVNLSVQADVLDKIVPGLLPLLTVTGV